MIKILNSKILKDGKQIFWDDVINHLNDEVEFADDLVFGKVFDLILENSKLYNKLFYDVLGGADIDLLKNDYYKVNPDTKTNYDIHIFWDALVTLNRELKDTVKIQPLMTGYGILEKNKGPEYIGLCFTRIGEFKNKKIILKEELIFDDNISKIIAKIETSKFTLYDIIKAVLMEISFNGAPETKNLVKTKPKPKTTKSPKKLIKKTKKIIVVKEHMNNLLDVNNKQQLEDEEYKIKPSKKFKKEINSMASEANMDIEMKKTGEI